MTLKSAILAAVTGEAAQETDPYYNLVSLHLKGDVNTGRSYNAFSDASSNNFRLTNNGDVRGSSFSPYGTSWSGFFDGNGDYLSIPNSANLNTTGDFTIEGWAYLTSVSAYGGMFSMRASTGTTNGASITFLNTGYIEFAVNPGGQSLTTPTPLNQWFHVALVRSGSATNNCSCYLNGTRVAQFTSTSEANGASNGAVIGRYYANGSDVHWVTGYLSNVRYVVGTPVYSGATITVPTAPLTAISGTQVLTCHANRFIDRDNGAGTVALTLNGTLRISSFSPFLETDTTTGSGYFDGNADDLSIATNAAFTDLPGDWTIECWFYSTSTSGQSLAGTSSFNSSGFFLELNYTAAGRVSFVPVPWGNRLESSSSVFTINTWNHIAFVRSGTTVTIYVNGTSVASGTRSVTSNSQPLTIGQAGNGWDARYYFNGYISDFRIVKGAAVYTGAFTPPTKSLARSGAASASAYPSTTNVNTTFAESATSLLTLQERGAYNTIGFQDESEYQHVITRPSGANVAQGTFSPFSPNGWSVFFDGTSRLSSTTGSVLNWGAGNFTVEMWVYLTNTSSNMMLLEGPSNNEFQLFVESGILKAGFVGAGVSVSYTLPSTFANTWNHIAVVRSGTGASQVALYVNGVSQSTGTMSSSGAAAGFQIARTSAYTLFGYVAGVRVVKNQALTSGNFTVPVSAVTKTSVGWTGANVVGSITGTVSLLLCDSNRLVDSSGTVSAITVGGSPVTAAFSPFKPVAYDPAVHGGSAYFDGSGDYLEMPYNPAFKYVASQDFCLEFWAYAPSALTASYVISQVTSNNWGIILGVGVVTSGRMGVTYGNGSTASTQSLDDTGAFPIGQWVHVVLCRTSGTIALFVNGTRRSSASNTNAINLTGDRGIRIGAHQDGAAAQFWQGYISGMRSIQGGNPYDATLTTLNVPSVPPSVVGNTSFLLNFTNGGVIDSTGKNVIETVGNAGVVTTAIKKYGSGSMFFDGTGDYVTSYNANALFRIGNIYTIELWFYTTTIAAGAAGLICLATGASTNSGINIYRSGSEIICNDGTTGGTGPSSGSSAITANTWAHLAVVSDGTTTKMYIDGVLKGTYSGTTASSAALTYATVGANGDKSGVLNGYIDDFRITRGYARYVTGTGANANQMVFNGTNTLALPTKAFPDRGTASTLTSDLAAPSSVEALVVAGAGGGGAGYYGGGGGAGGFREFVGGNAISVSANTNYQLSVGAGGAGSTSSTTQASDGNLSRFSSLTSVGGGGGGSNNVGAAYSAGRSGGSGGGAASEPQIGGAGTAGQGNAGAPVTATANSYGGGGGGAGAAGTTGLGGTSGGEGGIGLQSSITGVSTYYAGGGGGGQTNKDTAGGLGGGGKGGRRGTGPYLPDAGTANTGGGGGGGADTGNNGAAGGSGVVIIAYPTSFRPLKASLGLVYTIDTVTRPGYRVYRFTSGTGSISW